MKLNLDENYRCFLFLVCMFKVYHDSGIDYFETCDADSIVNDMDFYYEYMMRGIECAAPIVETTPGLYHKHGYCDMDDVNIWAYSSKEMQKYFQIARKLYRLEGKKEKENPYINEIKRKIENARGFYSYNFDYFYGKKRSKARLEVLWGYEFECDLALNLWIVRTFRIFKEELPKLQEKYRKVRREKRSRPKRKEALCIA